MPPTATPVESRFWSKVRKGRGCWEWVGAKTPTGYGKISDRAGGYRHPRAAHQVSWELHFGPIPTGAYVCHHCDNPGCVRPDHLFLGDAKSNMQDKVAKGRHHNSAKTHCKHGHEFSPENTYPNRGGRTCRKCNAAAQKALKDRRREADE